LARVSGASHHEISEKLLAETQEAWTRFRQEQCAFRADLARGGTLSGLSWLCEAETKTEVHLKQLW